MWWQQELAYVFGMALGLLGGVILVLLCRLDQDFMSPLVAAGAIIACTTAGLLLALIVPPMVMFFLTSVIGCALSISCYCYFIVMANL